MILRRIRTAVAAVAITAALSGCATTVNGSGRSVTGGTQSGDFPLPTTASSDTPAQPPSLPSTPTPPSDTSTSGPVGTFTCPTISYPSAHLKFDCIVDGLTLNTKNDIWPVSMYKTVEASTGWVLEEGAGNWGNPGADSPTDIALEVRGNMVAGGGYGKTPTVTTVVSADATVGGVPARVLESTITLNPAWAKGRGTKVASERLWIVVLKVTGSNTSLWYTSIPDLASELWAKVPAIMQTIRVG